MSDQKKDPSKKPKPGQRVLLRRLPEGFTDDLPLEDQRAISAAMTQPMVLNQYEDDGRAELEFTDANGTVHFIYVDSGLIELW